MVLTLPAHGSFYIIARYKSLGAGTNGLLPVKARVGRTCEALERLLNMKLVDGVDFYLPKISALHILRFVYKDDQFIEKFSW